ncbi:hypothetical protein H8959_020800 [Pygathrix nigripes]
MQCLGIRSRSRSRELYLQEQSLKVAALNGQRLEQEGGAQLLLPGSQHIPICAVSSGLP